MRRGNGCRQSYDGLSAGCNRSSNHDWPYLRSRWGRLPAPAVPGRDPVLLLASRLAAMGIERGPTESLAETVARAMGIDGRDLRRNCAYWREVR